MKKGNSIQKVKNNAFPNANKAFLKLIKLVNAQAYAVADNLYLIIFLIALTLVLTLMIAWINAKISKKMMQ